MTPMPDALQGRVAAVEVACSTTEGRFRSIDVASHRIACSSTVH
jgi:hypothetical protein